MSTCPTDISTDCAVHVLSCVKQKACKSFLSRLFGLGLFLILMALPHAMANTNIGLGELNIQIGQSGRTGAPLSTGLQLLIFMTVLTLIPAILMMSTAFTRIVIVMSMMRQAVGTPQLPPNQIIIGLSLILTFFVMTPTFEQINKIALKPYLANQMPIEVALEKATGPLRLFMFKQTAQEDIELFCKLAKMNTPKTTADVPTYVLLPAFSMSELKTAFQFGFVVFLPFLVIDMVVSSILVSMGMLFLPPMTISLPFKIILFVLVDGWRILTEALVSGFH